MNAGMYLWDISYVREIGSDVIRNYVINNAPFISFAYFW